MKPSPLKPLSLRSNLSWSIAGNVVNMGCQWARVVVLAFLGGVEMVGLVVLAFAICTPICALSRLGLRSAAVTDTRQEYRFGDYLALRLVMGLLALLIIVGIVLAGRYEAQSTLIILLVALGELFKSVSDIFHALFQQHERMDRIAISLVVRSMLMLALLTLGIYLTGSVLWGMAGFPLAVAVVFVAFDVPTAARIVGASSGGARGALATLRPRWHLRTLLNLTWLTLPLGIAITMIALNISIPRYLIGHYLGMRELGVFVMILYLAVVGSKLVAAMSTSAGTRLAKHYAAGNTAAYSRLLGKLLALSAAVGLAVVLTVALLGAPILGLLYGAGFSRYAELAVYVTAAAAVMYLASPMTMAIDAMRRFKSHLVMRGIGIAVLLLLLPGFLQAYALKGAAAAMLIASAVTVLGNMAVVYAGIRSCRKRDFPATAIEVPAARAA